MIILQNVSLQAVYENDANITMILYFIEPVGMAARQSTAKLVRKRQWTAF